MTFLIETPRLSRPARPDGWNLAITTFIELLHNKLSMDMKTGLTQRLGHGLLDHLFGEE